METSSEVCALCKLFPNCFALRRLLSKSINPELIPLEQCPSNYNIHIWVGLKRGKIGIGFSLTKVVLLASKLKLSCVVYFVRTNFVPPNINIPKCLGNFISFYFKYIVFRINYNYFIHPYIRCTCTKACVVNWIRPASNDDYWWRSSSVHQSGYSVLKIKPTAYFGPDIGPETRTRPALVPGRISELPGHVPPNLAVSGRAD